MERRTFLGSILGAFATGENFLVQKAQPQYCRTRFDSIKRAVRLFEISLTELKKCRFLIPIEDFNIYSPPMLDVERDMDKMKIVFRGMKIEMKQELIVTGMKLIDDKSLIVRDKITPIEPIKFMPRDVLHLTYTLEMGLGW